MSLQCKGTGRKPASLRRNSVFIDGFSVDLYGDLVALHDDMLGKPFVILGRRNFYILYGVYASRSAPVGVAVIHLDLVTFLWPSFFLVGGMNIHPGVGAWLCHDLGFVLKILEAMILNGPHIKQVRPVA